MAEFDAVWRGFSVTSTASAVASSQPVQHSYTTQNDEEIIITQPALKSREWGLWTMHALTRQN